MLASGRTALDESIFLISARSSKLLMGFPLDRGPMTVDELPPQHQFTVGSTAQPITRQRPYQVWECLLDQFIMATGADRKGPTSVGLWRRREDGEEAIRAPRSQYRAAGTAFRIELNDPLFRSSDRLPSA